MFDVFGTFGVFGLFDAFGVFDVFDSAIEHLIYCLKVWELNIGIYRL